MFPVTDTKVYIALIAFLANLIVTVVLTVVFRALKVRRGRRPDPAAGLPRRRRRPGVEDELEVGMPAHG